MAVKSMDSVTVYDYNDVTQVRTWYKTVPRTSAAPTVSPTATEAQVTANGWVTAEPAVDTAKKLYTVQECMFGDGSYIWGTVSLSSSYEAAIQAYNKAQAAESAASETAQYFWLNATDSGAGEGAGAHITEKEKAAFIADPASGGGNVLIDSDSIDVRDGTKALASFGADGAQIGADDNARVVMSPAKTEMLTRFGDPYFSASVSGGGTTMATESYVLASNRKMTNTSTSDPMYMILLQGIGSAPLSLLEDGQSFTITLKISHYHKNNNSSTADFEKILSRTITHTFTKGTAEQYDGGSYSIAQNPDYFQYDTKINYFTSSSSLQIALMSFKRTVGNSAYSYRVVLEEATMTMQVTKDVPLITLGGKVVVAGDLLCSNIGDFKSYVGSEISCATGKYYQIAYITLDPGVWMVDCVGHFPNTNTTGIRDIRVTTATSGYNNVTTAPASYGNITADRRTAAAHIIYANSHFPVSITATTTFRLIAYQNSGQTVSVNGRMYAVRIK